MAGKRKVFEQSLREASSLAWDGRWDEAILAYQRALAEFPKDVAARASLAQALAAAGRVDDALAEYREVCALSPADPLPRLHVAEICAGRGETVEAVRQFSAAAAIFESDGQPDRAIELLEQAVQAAPGSLEPRERLAALYLDAGKRHAAVEQFLAQARVYQERGQPEKAVQRIQTALEANPRSSEARQALEAARQGMSAGKPKSAGKAASEPEVAQRASPAETARRRALSELAAAVFDRDDEASPPAGEEGRPADAERRERINGLLGQAIDFQTRGLLDDAISSYTRALEAGADSRAIHFNLGMLYQEQSRQTEAVEQFTASLADPEYTVAGHFALGECYRAQSALEPALKHYFQVVRTVDLKYAKPASRSDLAQMYDGFAANYLGTMDKDHALVFISSVVDFLSDPEWEEKVVKARRRLDSLSENGFVTSLAELLETPNSEIVLDAIGRSQDYARRQLYLAAAEESFRAIGESPGYLPLHLGLAAILVQQGDTTEAVAKYLVIADTYLVRGERKQSLEVYRQALNLSPMDAEVRKQFIRVLVDLRQIDTALEEYLTLADSYYQMARVDLAISAYEDALRLVGRSRSKETWETRFLHLLADIYVQSVDWIKARKAYERVLALAPDDALARRRLIELSFKLEDRHTGLRHLDALLERYAAAGAGDETLEGLRELADACPTVIELRSQLTDMYIARDMRDEAVASLNRLGEMQIDAGQQDMAAKTIRQLAKLEPERAEEYRSLLNQLLSGQPGAGEGSE